MCIRKCLFDTDELNEYINAVGSDLFIAPLSEQHLRNLKKLITLDLLIQPALEDVESILKALTN